MTCRCRVPEADHAYNSDEKETIVHNDKSIC